MDPGEFFGSLHVLVLIIPVVGAALLATLTDWAHWAVERGILASALEDPLLPIPLADGAGLDLTRLIIVAAIVVAVSVVASVLVRPYRARAQLRAMREGDMS
ncbi:hypothetical protein G6031_02765 [Dietzia sp. CQ4]|uniref:hypothetical protein n=1 Tax=Dietzia sp. (strain CQ4) TaxID=370437 RepID=UPI0015F93A6F|nr:hypothetical protein [Dietzia sp. CQ4]MBB1033310.1 hypothetical protein [Dietzia sp. CQ4]